ncbi:glucose-6-phosphate dehydrogenase [Candidatus Nomurabacteria bacterium]|nr:glucose-6-phosphate dehydrogenase [Candidatus Nomurabacteria bacterium]
MLDSGATQILILGGTGDLSRRKLLPALLDLYARGMLPEVFHIIGLARSKWGRHEYSTFVKESIDKYHLGHTHTAQQVNDFCSHISFVSGSFDDFSSYDRLQSSLDEFDVKRGVRSNRLFYLAVPPKHYSQIFNDLKKSGVADESEKKWTHILVEKPFGNNLQTAQELDSQLAKLYREDQIFRIDHYLAKEAVQNILSFRFANTLLKAPWDKDSVQSVYIKMTETIDVGGRSGFYEGVGALRDVGQNHLLQLLALVAMKEPDTFTVEAIRDARTEVLESLRPVTKETLNDSVIRAQYDGYKSDEAIPNDSETETYFELKTFVDSPTWKDVPFFIQAGKALEVGEVSITINFKDVATGLFETKTCFSIGNQIKLTISPEQEIAITLNAKSPDLGYQLETRTLSYKCKEGENKIKNSYEKVLYDSIVGDQTLFTKTEEVHAAWKFITPILETWNKLPLHTYKKGSAGPVETLLKM